MLIKGRSRELTGSQITDAAPPSAAERMFHVEHPWGHWGHYPSDDFSRSHVNDLEVAPPGVSRTSWNRFTWNIRTGGRRGRRVSRRGSNVSRGTPTTRSVAFRGSHYHEGRAGESERFSQSPQNGARWPRSRRYGGPVGPAQACSIETDYRDLAARTR